MELKASNSGMLRPLLSARNPFNGIERLSLLSPLLGSSRSSNPFNGIERYRFSLLDSLREEDRSGIHSMELKAVKISPFLKPSLLENPFNGIES